MTLNGIGPGCWDSGKLARAQEQSEPLLYRLYTEHKPNLVELVSRYFTGATIYTATDLWQGETELSRVIEILGSSVDRQNIIYLAGDIRQVNQQSAVIVTWQSVGMLTITDQTLADVQS